MKIAIDSGPLTSGHAVRGIGAHTKELITSLKLVAKDSDIEIDAFDFQKDKEKLQKENFDVIHFTAFNPFFISIPFSKPANTKFVLTVHDLIPLIYPEHYKAGIRGALRFMINKFLIRKNVDAIVTISETSKKDICRFLKINPKKVYVAYLAPRIVFGKRQSISNKNYKLPEKFALYVGDVNFNKNIPVLIKACKIANIPLVIVGKQALDIEDRGIDLRTLNGPMDFVRYLFGRPHPELAHYDDLLTAFKNNKKIIRLGFATDGDLAGIYKKASIYCQPSLYEGFGLPVLEAMLAGTPVVASKIQSLVEIAEGGAVFVDPNDSEAMARGIKKLIENKTLRASLIESGFNIVKNFSWEETARQTLAAYKA